jgi:hypothetical protein
LVCVWITEFEWSWAGVAASAVAGIPKIKAPVAAYAKGDSRRSQVRLMKFSLSAFDRNAYGVS